MKWVTSNGIYSGSLRNCRKLNNTFRRGHSLLELERASKENSSLELGEEKDFSNETSTEVSATSSIFSVNDIQQNLPSTSTPIQPSSCECSNKTSRGQVSQEAMEGMLENCRNKRIQRKLPEAQASTNSEEGKL